MSISLVVVATNVAAVEGPTPNLVAALVGVGLAFLSWIAWMSSFGAPLSRTNGFLLAATLSQVTLAVVAALGLVFFPQLGKYLYRALLLGLVTTVVLWDEAGRSIPEGFSAMHLALAVTSALACVGLTIAADTALERRRAGQEPQQ